LAPFYAHSLQDRDKRQWQPLAEHLRSVAEGAGARGAKFGARKAAALAGLMHDLGKYSLAFQRRLEGAGEKVDHSTAGAQRIVRSAADPDAKIVAKVIAHTIAGIMRDYQTRSATSRASTRGSSRRSKRSIPLGSTRFRQPLLT
jgi:CRISPR-associated endonuclease Cas3-HD